MENKNVIEKSIKFFSKLPGFGPRSAKRAILHLIKNKNILNLIEVLKELEENIKECRICHNISGGEKCDICMDSRRDFETLCVVSEVEDIWNFERGEMFKGIYHSLGGSLSATSGITPEKLNIQSLLIRLTENEIKEVISANNLSIDGATTTFYILEEISALQNTGKINKDLKITELANGIPIGGMLEYMDGGTIKAAFNARHRLY